MITLRREGLGSSSKSPGSKVFFNVGPSKESIFLTTIYGLYFSHHYTLDFLQITFLRVSNLCGQLLCTALTNVYLTCWYYSWLLDLCCAHVVFVGYSRPSSTYIQVPTKLHAGNPGATCSWQPCQATV